MISVFAPGTLVASLFCLAGWCYLAYRNLFDRRFWFTIACISAVGGYGFAIWQYIELFYIARTPQPDNAMWLLFIRMLCHCATVLIFCYHYRGSFRR